jgi:hypothetical protein
MFLIDVLHIENCEGKERAICNLNSALRELNFNSKEYFLNVREIKNEKEAKLWKLAGSPTIKVNGIDIEQNKSRFGLYKRQYSAGKSAPDVDRIKNALQMDIRGKAKALLEASSAV